MNGRFVRGKNVRGRNVRGKNVRGKNVRGKHVRGKNVRGNNENLCLMCNISNYEFIGNNRKLKRGGGVGVYIRIKIYRLIPVQI